MLPKERINKDSDQGKNKNKQRYLIINLEEAI